MRRPAGASAARRRRWALLSLLGGVAVGAWLHARSDLPIALWDADSRQYADAARRIAGGEGFTTGIIYPIALARGVGSQHPVLLLPPLWPLGIASFFAVSGPDERALHAASLVCFVAAVAMAALLGFHLGGAVAGSGAGLATAGSGILLSYAATPGTEFLFAVWVTLTFLLVAQRRHAFWVGVVCGLAYLTRHNGVLLAPVAFVMLLERRRGLAGAASLAVRLGAGLALVVSPWWIRNLLVTGDPFFSYAHVYLNWAQLDVLGRQKSPLFQIEPSTAVAWGGALHKAARSLPELLPWIPGTLGVPACLGLLLACLRRERVGLGLLGLLALSVVLIVFTVPSGRYLVPFMPALYAVAAAAWWRHGGRLRVPALALLLVAAWLPGVPREGKGVRYLRHRTELLRESIREDAYAAQLTDAREALRRCVPRRSLVLARDATRFAWETDAIAIYTPASPAGIRRVLDEHPIAWVQLRPGHPLPRSQDFLERYRPRPDCGEGLYERRATG